MAAFLLFILLAGCVTIPLADGGTLEISQDGINVTPGEDSVDDETDENTVEKVKVDSEIAAENDEEEPATEEDEEDGQTEIEGEGLGGCANEFYLLENRLPKSFPIPTCAYVRHLELVEDEYENMRMIIAHYDAYGAIREETEVYQSFFEDEGYEITVVSQTDTMSELVVAGKGIEMTVRNSQVDGDAIVTEIAYTETPIKQYEIVESIINHTGKGYGKCTDEYYTLLSVLSEDYPLPECAKVTFLQIENHDTVRHSFVTYEVDRYWTEEFDSYEKYATDNNYTISRNEGIATFGEIEFDKDDVTVNVTTTKMTMDKTETHVTISKVY